MTSPEYVCLWPDDDDDPHFGYPKTQLEEQTLTNISSNQSYNIPAPPPLPDYTAYLNKKHPKKPSNYSGIICRETRDTWDKVFKQGFGADVHVVTDNNTTIPAHSIFLRAASPVLESFLQQSELKNGKIHLKLPGAPHAAVYAFIRFLYSSCYEEEDMKNHVLHLLVLSHAFSVPRLKRVCVQFLEQEWLNTENVIDVLQLARNCDAPRLSLICVRMIVRDFKSVSATDGWKVMRRSTRPLNKNFWNQLWNQILKRERVVKEEERVYVQLHEAMEALVHICKDGCRGIGPREKTPKSSQVQCTRAACKSLEMLVGHFAGCKRRVPGGCVHCKRFWQLLELHSRMCTHPQSCAVPLCWQFKEKLQHPSKKEEAKWRLLVTKVVEAKSVENRLLSKRLSLY